MTGAVDKMLARLLTRAALLRTKLSRDREGAVLTGPRRMTRREAGMTLIELIVAFTVLLILSTMALPLMTIRVRREKERRLRQALEEMRTAIDRYKDAADQGLLGEQDPDNHGYPESLDILVEGVEVNQQPGMGMGGQMGAGGMPGQMGMGGQMGGMSGQSGFGSSRPGGIGSNRQSSFGSNRQSGIGANRNSGGFGSSRDSRSGSDGFGSSRSGRSGFGGEGEDEEGPKTVRFLRRIPVDPMTGRAEWGKRSISDSPDSMSWGGRNVFDVFSMSMDTALDGSRYSEW